MWKNNVFNDITELLVNRRLGKAIDLLENYLLTTPRQSDMDQLLLLKNDYSLMTDYWRKGFQDSQREQLYDQLLRRLYVLATNVALHDRIRNTSFFMSAYSRPRQSRQDWSLSAIRTQLENYVSDVAMLELEPENKRREKGERLYREHQQMMNDLFDYIWTSRLWKDSLAEAFEDLLLTPTIDSVDQQLIVSAITLTAMNCFGINKFRVLVNIYEKATDEALRQRALVGWVLCADGRMAKLYPEMREWVKRLCEDVRVRKELTELQMQMLFCMSAEDDQQKIQNEIIPDLMKGNNLRFTRQGIVEQEDDPIENILHPDAAERNMERMEQSMHRMMDMQKQGSDIYFAGFSQMKRFPFFNNISNWFVPFYPQHPGISETWHQSRGHRFLQTIVKLGAFCDSDKYSFVLAYHQVLDRLPRQMIDLVEKGEAVPVPVGGEVPTDEQQQPAFIRRLYLQNLYRFFRLFPLRSEFNSPFEPATSVFFSNSLFHGTALEAHMPEVASFLMKRHYDDEASKVLDNLSEEHYDINYYLLRGSIMMRHKNFDAFYANMAMTCYSEALEQEPDNVRALKGYARACFSCQNYVGALDTYEKLQKLQPDQESVQLNTSVCLTHLERYEEALKLLYKLNYLYPDDDSVTRVLAWTLTVSGKSAQAVKLYDQLLSAEKPQTEDMLNYGLCLWFSGDLVSAVGMLRQFLTDQKDSQFSIEQELLHNEHDLICRQGITDTEIQLMLDCLLL